MSLVLVLGGILVLVGRSLWEQRKHHLLDLIDVIPGVSQHIRDFHRTKIVDGKKVWEVAAQDAQYLEETKTVSVRGVNLQWYMKDGRSVGLKGNEGRITLDGREVSNIDLQGNIEVSLGDYHVRVASASYEQAKEAIHAPGQVEISGRAMELRGVDMTIDVQGERMVLNQVNMNLHPADFPQGGGDAPL